MDLSVHLNILFYLGIYLFSYPVVKHGVNFFFKGNNLDKDRMNYVCKNFVKVIALSILVVRAFYGIIDALCNDVWDNKVFYELGYAYAMTDVAGLIMVRRLPINTKIHHATTLVLSFLNTFNDYTQPTIWRGLILYSYFSALALLVNLYLGLRVIIPNEKCTQLCRIALWNYITVCYANWFYQVNLISKTGISGFFSVLYVGLIIMIMYDDIKLIQFLRYQDIKYRLLDKISYKDKDKNAYD